MKNDPPQRPVISPPAIARPTVAQVGFVLLVSIVIVAAAGKTILFDTLDPDCFWHLRVAEQLQRDGIGPLVDDLSFTSMRQPWTPYSWLAELGMKRLWDLGGYRAAVLVQAIVIAWFFAMIAAIAAEMTRPPRPYVGITVALVFAAYVALPYLSFRPTTLAFALLATCMWLIQRDARLEHQSLTVWLIAPITALAANVHLFAVVVPIWMAAFVLERRTFRSLWLLALTVGACGCTPMFQGFARAIIHFGAHDPMVAAGAIAELVPFYRGEMWWITAAVLVFAIGAMAWRSDTTGSGDWLCMGIGLIGMLRMGRIAPIFAIVAAPMLATALPSLRGRALGRPIVCGILAAVVIASIWRLNERFPRPQVPLATWLNRRGADLPGYPCQAAAFVKNNVRPNTGRLINEFNWGGYLSFELGGDFKVFMDARTQLYSPEFWHATCLGDDARLRATLSKVTADAAILPLDDRRIAPALLSLRWKQVYQDERAVVLVPG